jgi:hypothetical protein
MSAIDNLTPEQAKALETAEKLFRLAGKNPNKHEAEAATAKAMKILEDLNLDMSVIEQGGTEKAKRSDEKMKGGLYKWQRELWKAIADLHFCFYWSMYNYDPNKKNIYQSRLYGERVMGGYRFEHRVVGRSVNVIAVRNMAQYLEQTIERLTRDHIDNEYYYSNMSKGQAYYTNYATSYRSGIAEEVIGKIYDRRQSILNEEKRKQREAEERAAQAGMASASDGRSLTLSSVAKSEEEANYDFLNGDGAYAKRAARIADAARRQREAEEEYARWAAANPEEARKAEAEARKNRRRTSWNAGTARPKDNRDWSAYKAGRRAGEGVSIDPQAEARKTARIG